MKDELRRYVNKFPTVAIENLNELGSPALFSDYTVPKVGSRVGFSVRSNEGVWNHETGVVKSIMPVTYQWESASGEVYTQESYKYNVSCDDGIERLLCLACDNPERVSKDHVGEYVTTLGVCVERERFLPKSRWMYFFEDEVLALYENGDSCTKDSWEDILSELGFIVVEDDTFGLFFGCDGEVGDEVWDTLLDIIEDGMKGSAEEPQSGRLICGKCPKRYYISELEDAIGRDEINRMIEEKNTILCPACAVIAGYGRKEE